MSATKDERLAEYFLRLREARSAHSATEARHLLEVTLNAVENELTEIPYDPSQWASDGRMYPIQEDNWEERPQGGQVGRSRGHQTIVGDNGAIEIRRKSDGAVEFSKLGSDGKGVER